MVCINKSLFILCLCIILLLIFLQYIYLTAKFTNLYLQNKENKISSQQQITNDTIKIIPQLISTVQNDIPNVQYQNNITPMFPITDPIKTYDYNKINDPLEEPTKRVDRYLLGPIQFRRMFNYPVRGDPDNPRWLGLLICDSDDDRANKLIK